MIENEQVEEIMLVLDDKLSKTVSVLKEDYSVIRAGRAKRGNIRFERKYLRFYRAQRARRRF